jgi:hypothetical protein
MHKGSSAHQSTSTAVGIWPEAATLVFVFDFFAMKRRISVGKTEREKREGEGSRQQAGDRENNLRKVASIRHPHRGKR